MRETASALLPAAGKGRRFGNCANKVFEHINGKPILAHCVEVFEACSSIDEIVIVVGEQDLEMAAGVVSRFGYQKVAHIVAGGSQRQDSVYSGLARVSGDIVAIHDAARPMITREIIETSLAQARKSGACIAAVPVIDTIKCADANGVVDSTIDRNNLYSVQTPQTFRTSAIRQAYEKAFAEGFYATDDSALYERFVGDVTIIPGSYDNIKITTKADMALANAKLGGSQMRTGMGYDVHRLVEDRKLILGGVEFPHEKGLLGHSDADVLLHAVMDACLGAAGLGDIGEHFPDSDSKYSGCSSVGLLEEVGALVAGAGYRVNNLDVTLVCQSPKISKYKLQMAETIAKALQINADSVNIKGTTTEHLGFTGRGEGISCYAVAMLVGA